MAIICMITTHNTVLSSLYHCIFKKWSAIWWCQAGLNMVNWYSMCFHLSTEYAFNNNSGLVTSHAKLWICRLQRFQNSLPQHNQHPSESVGIVCPRISKFFLNFLRVSTFMFRRIFRPDTIMFLAVSRSSRMLQYSCELALIDYQASSPTA